MLDVTEVPVAPALYSPDFLCLCQQDALLTNSEISRVISRCVCKLVSRSSRPSLESAFIIQVHYDGILFYLAC